MRAFFLSCCLAMGLFVTTPTGALACGPCETICNCTVICGKPCNCLSGMISCGEYGVCRDSPACTGAAPTKDVWITAISPAETCVGSPSDLSTAPLKLLMPPDTNVQDRQRSEQSVAPPQL